MVHVKRGEKQTLYAYLLNEGVCTVKEENTGKHEQTKIDNLKVLNSMISMESRGFATKTFVWNHRYYTITNEGCQFLRDQLGVTNANVNPKTHQQKPVEQNAGAGGPDRRNQMSRGRGGFRGGDREGGFRGGGDREGGFRGSGEGRGRGGFRGGSRPDGDAPEKEHAKPQPGADIMG